ncbi:MAG: hypothetical protein ACE5HT_01140 [Gemmatimonadales bacterium]
MYIELAEFLVCPAGSDHHPCVVSSDDMKERSVVVGTVGCPTCKAEYPIVDGIVHFGRDPLLGSDSRSDDMTVEETLDSAVVHPLLAIGDSGGYVVLLGSAGRVVQDLAAQLPEVQLVAVNPPPDVHPFSSLSVLRATATVPLKSAMARGVVVGVEYSRDDWLAEAVRVLISDSHLVVGGRKVSVPGVAELAVGEGLWVGQKN